MSDDDWQAAEHASRTERGERVAEFGTWEWSAQSGVLLWSDNLYRLLGLQPGAVTPSSKYVLSVTHPDDRERLARLIAFMGQEGHLAPIECRIVRPDGTIRRLRATTTAVHADPGGASSTAGVVEDVTDEVDADHQIASRIAVSGALDAWESLQSGAPRLLRELATALEFQVGTLWLPEDDALVARIVWMDREHDATDFANATKRRRLPRGECLPGKVWEVGEPINVVDVQRHAAYTRRDAAARADLHRAVGIPATHGHDVLAVIELIGRDAGRLDVRLMLSMRAIGSEVGQFLFHRRRELDPRKLTARQLQILELAAQGCSGGEIAERLCISTTTVKSHFTGIYARLDVSDRAAAVAEAMRYGLIQ